MATANPTLTKSDSSTTTPSGCDMPLDLNQRLVCIESTAVSYGAYGPRPHPGGSVSGQQGCHGRSLAGDRCYVLLG